MVNRLRFFTPGAVLLSCLCLATPAAAQWGDRGRYDEYGNMQGVAYNNGYTDGFRHGEEDARRGRRFDPQNHGDFRNADRGYNRRYGHRGSYEGFYRNGFGVGYREGYERSGRGGGYAIPRGSPYPGSSRYPDRNSGPYGYPDRYGHSGYGNVAFDVGFSDGYEQGVDDSRDRDRYDPLRHRRYRSGDHRYERRYGSREQYKNSYRIGYRDGYDRGYREGARYTRDRYGRDRYGRRGRGGFRWPF